MSQIKSPSEVPTNEAGGGFERGEAPRYILITTQDAYINTRVPKVGTDLYIGHCDKSNPRVIQLAQDNLAYFFPDLFPEAFGSPPRHKSYPGKRRTSNDSLISMIPQGIFTTWVKFQGQLLGLKPANKSKGGSSE